MKINSFNLFKILGSVVMCMVIMVSMMVSTTNQAEAAKVKAVNAAKIAVKIAKNNKNGYSQANRTRKNKLGGHEYDCSSLVYTVYKKAGVKVGMGCSSTIKSHFKKKGFIYISRSKAKLSSYKKLKTGDVLVASGHVEIYVGNGKLVGAHGNYDGRPGDSSGKEISVTKYRGSGWYCVLRYNRGSSKTTSTAKPKTTTPDDNDEDESIDQASQIDEVPADKTGGDDEEDTTTPDTTDTTDTTVEETKTDDETPAADETPAEDTKDDDPAPAETVDDTEVSTTTTKTKKSSKKSSKYSTGTWKTKISMNVRRGPGLKYKSVGSLKKGSVVKVTQVKGRFGKISYKGKTAWVSLKYSKKI